MLLRRFYENRLCLYHSKTVSHKNRSWVRVILKKRMTLQFLSPRPARLSFFIVSFIFPRLSRRRIHRWNQTQCPLSWMWIPLSQLPTSTGMKHSVPKRKSQFSLKSSVKHALFKSELNRLLLWVCKSEMATMMWSLERSDWDSVEVGESGESTRSMTGSDQMIRRVLGYGHSEC